MNMEFLRQRGGLAGDMNRPGGPSGAPYTVSPYGSFTKSATPGGMNPPAWDRIPPADQGGFGPGQQGFGQYPGMSVGGGFGGGGGAGGEPGQNAGGGQFVVPPGLGNWLGDPNYDNYPDPSQGGGGGGGLQNYGGYNLGGGGDIGGGGSLSGWPSQGIGQLSGNPNWQYNQGPVGLGTNGRPQQGGPGGGPGGLAWTQGTGPGGGGMNNGPQNGQGGYGGGFPSQSYSGPSMNYNQSAGWHGTYIVPGMGDIYGQLLGLNEKNYNNLLGYYGQAQGNLQSQLPGIVGGYGNLEQGVMNTLGIGNGGWGVAGPAATAIGEQAAQARGATQQSMTNSGLANTTALGNFQNQNALYAGQAYAGLGAQLAQTAAGYEASLGQAGLGAQMQGLGMENQLASGLMGGLAGYHFANTAGALTGGFGQQYSQGYGMNSGSQSVGAWPGYYDMGGYPEGQLGVGGDLSSDLSGGNIDDPYRIMR